MIVKKITKWWFAPKFPEKHVDNILNYSPEGFYKKLRNLYRTWIVHPIKRRVARIYRAFLQKFFRLKIIGITGSAGKTTTKEMIASVLEKDGKTVKSYANIDPVYNIPTTIFKCKPSTKYLVLEMGVEYKNEMDFYNWLAKPDIGVITNIYPTHLEFFGDVEGVFKEKSKLVNNLDSKSLAVLNKSDDFLKKLKNIKAKIIWYGTGSKIYANRIKLKDNGETNFVLNLNDEKTEVKLPILGRQFVNDALAAAAVATSLGIGKSYIKKGLASFKLPKNRMRVFELKNGAVVIDDSYNNNPEAAKAALKTLDSFEETKKIVVFGDMLELGDYEVEAHKEIGRMIPKHADYLIAVGHASKILVKEAGKKMGKNASWVTDQSEVVSVIKPLITNNTTLLIKGSRSIGLDKVVNKLK